MRPYPQTQLPLKTSASKAVHQSSSQSSPFMNAPGLPANQSCASLNSHQHLRRALFQGDMEGFITQQKTSLQASRIHSRTPSNTLSQNVSQINFQGNQGNSQVFSEFKPQIVEGLKTLQSGLQNGFQSIYDVGEELDGYQEKGFNLNCLKDKSQSQQQLQGCQDNDRILLQGKQGQQKAEIQIKHRRQKSDQVGLKQIYYANDSQNAQITQQNFQKIKNNSKNSHKNLKNNKNQLYIDNQFIPSDNQVQQNCLVNPDHQSHFNSSQVPVSNRHSQKRPISRTPDHHHHTELSKGMHKRTSRASQQEQRHNNKENNYNYTKIYQSFSSSQNQSQPLHFTHLNKQRSSGSSSRLELTRSRDGLLSAEREEISRSRNKKSKTPRIVRKSKNDRNGDDSKEGQERSKSARVRRDAKGDDQVDLRGEERQRKFDKLQRVLEKSDGQQIRMVESSQKMGQISKKSKSARKSRGMQNDDKSREALMRQRQVQDQKGQRMQGREDERDLEATVVIKKNIECIQRQPSYQSYLSQNSHFNSRNNSNKLQQQLSQTKEFTFEENEKDSPFSLSSVTRIQIQQPQDSQARNQPLITKNHQKSMNTESSSKVHSQLSPQKTIKLFPKHSEFQGEHQGTPEHQQPASPLYPYANMHGTPHPNFQMSHTHQDQQQLGSQQHFSTLKIKACQSQMMEISPFDDQQLFNTKKDIQVPIIKDLSQQLQDKETGREGRVMDQATMTDCYGPQIQDQSHQQEKVNRSVQNDRIGQASQGKTDSVELSDDRMSKAGLEFWSNLSRFLKSHEDGSSIDLRKIKEIVYLGLSELIVDIKEVDIGERIGEGSTSQVFKGEFKYQEIAIKKIEMSFMNQKQIMYLVQELECLKRLRHPHISMLIGVALDINENLYLLIELFPNGTLCSLLQLSPNSSQADNPYSQSQSPISRKKEQRPLTITQKLQILQDVSLSLFYLHSLKILHRDLKPENVFVTEHWRAKIGDFGTAKVQELDPQSQVKTDTVATPSYMAPEVMSTSLYSQKSDVYSFAILAWELLFEEEAFKGLQDFALINAVAMEHQKPDFDVDKLRSKIQIDGFKGDVELMIVEVKQLVQKCWDSEPGHRPNMEQVLLRIKEIRKMEGSLSG